MPTSIHAIPRVDQIIGSGACSESSPTKRPSSRRSTSGLNLPHLVARILATRGIRTCEDGGALPLPEDRAPLRPLLLPDMEAAVDAVARAPSKSGRKIGLFGDYDADGVTSTALMVNFLGSSACRPEVYLPGREEGYGLNAEGSKDAEGRRASTFSSASTAARRT